MSCWEELCITLGFRLLHDGQQNPGQFELPPDQVRFYTRLYQGMMDGKPISTFVKFIYDEREGEVDMEISIRDPRRNAKRREQMTMVMPVKKEA